MKLTEYGFLREGTQDDHEDEPSPKRKKKLSK